MWIFGLKGESGFSARSTAEQVTHGIDASSLTAIVTVRRLVMFRCIKWYWCRNRASSCTARCACRDGCQECEAGRTVKETILKEIPNARIDVMELDLSSMESVRKFASEFNSSGLPLNILVNNAGVMATPFTLSKDGIELQFATNHIGHFLLTNLLLETMKKTVQESNQQGRIINVSSEGHRFAYREGICFDKINDESWYNSLGAYGQSKLANILHANELAHRLKEEGVDIIANALHPGSIATSLLRHRTIIDGIIHTVGKYLLKTIPQGAATTCYVALHPQVKEITGEYFTGSNKATASSLAKDIELAKKLWDFSMNLTESK